MKFSIFATDKINHEFTLICKKYLIKINNFLRSSATNSKINKMKKAIIDDKLKDIIVASKKSSSTSSLRKKFRKAFNS